MIHHMLIHTRVLFFTALWLSAQLVLSSPLFAQDPVDDGQSNVDIYPSDYFEQFSPVTAADMLERIPGISFILSNGNGGNRGFGSNRDRILINGRRVSGKGSDGSTVLERTSADQVKQIEIMRTGSDESDNRSIDTQVNIVLRPVIDKGSGTWLASLARYKGGVWRPGGKLTYAGSFSNLDYSVAFKATPKFGSRHRMDDSLTPDLLLTEQSFQNDITNRTDLSVSGDLAMQWKSGDALRLNGIYIDRGRTIDTDERSFSVTPSGDLVFDGREFENDRRPEFEWEIGGDYERPIGNALKFKLLGLHNVISRKLEEFKGDVLPSDRVITGKTLSERVSTESIIRSSINWKISQKHDLEFGAEGALNTQDSELRIFRMVGGQLVERSITLGKSKVEEERGEVFLIHNWKIGPKLKLQSALIAELSTISQKGADFNASRSFLFLKPALDVRYSASPNDKFQASIERQISQLSFSSFVASLNDPDDELNEGNPELEQEKTWAFEAIWDRKLRNDGSSIRTRVFYDYIEDVIEEIALPGTDLGATGNVGNGQRYGVEWELSLKLDWLHLPGAIIEAQYERKWSSVRDPFTGKKRTFSFQSPTNYSFEFRHDVTAWNLFYGIAYDNGSRFRDFEIDEIRSIKNQGTLDAFIEYRFPNGWTLRLDGEKTPDRAFPEGTAQQRR